MRWLIVPLFLLISGCIVVREPRRTVPPPPPPAPVAYSSTAVGTVGPVHGAVPVAMGPWRFLGERTVHHGRDRDTIHVGAHDGTFSALELRVERSPIQLYDLAIDFGDGTRWHPAHEFVFGANSWSHVIDLPGGGRVIRDVHFLYRDLPGGGLAKVELWGR